MSKARIPRRHKIPTDAELPAASATIINDAALLIPDVVERQRVVDALTPAELRAWQLLRARMLFDLVARRDAVMIAPPGVEAA